MASGSSNAAKRWQQVEITALDPFRDYKHAIDDHLDNATAVLSPFHVVKLAAQALDEARSRVQQAPQATAAGLATRSTAFRRSCEPGPRTCPTSKNTVLPPRSTLTRHTRKCSLPGTSSVTAPGRQQTDRTLPPHRPWLQQLRQLPPTPPAHRRGQDTRTTAKSDEPFIAQQLFGWSPQPDSARRRSAMLN